jgi:RimJ/RimL family protein N-acetyltransferase
LILVFNQNERVADYLIKKKAGTHFNKFQSIGFEKNGELVGGVIYDSYEEGYRCAISAAGEIGWLTRRTLGYIFDYPFNQLNVKVMTASALSGNKESCRVLEGIGFKEKARISEASANGDLIIYAMYREDCKYLKGNK